MNTAPILIIDDDNDDREFLQTAFQELEFSNPLVFFSEGELLLQYLETEEKPPFLILCDVNIPGMDGFSLKAKLMENKKTNLKSIPFVFLSATASKEQIVKAYELTVQGFFVKAHSLDKIKQSLVNICWYWQNCKTPE